MTTTRLPFVCTTAPEGGSCVLVMVQQGDQAMVGVHEHYEPGEAVPERWVQYARTMQHEATGSPRDLEYYRRKLEDHHG